jgi:hypothetical protein
VSHRRRQASHLSSERLQTITFDPIEAKTIGDSDFLLSALASSGLQISFTASGECTVTGTTVHLTNAGTCSITASQGGYASYNPAQPVTRSFLIEDVPMRTVLVRPTSGRRGRREAPLPSAMGTAMSP